MELTMFQKQLHLILFGAAVLFSGCLLFSAERSNLKAAPDRMKTEFQSEIRRRGLEKRFTEYSEYVSSKLTETRSIDKCRLSWVEQLVNQPLEASKQAEQFTASLYNASTGPQSVSRILDQLYSKMDLKFQNRNSKEIDVAVANEDPFAFVAAKLQEAKLSMDAAFGRLSASEQRELRERIYAVTTVETTQGFRFGGEDRGARIVDLIQRVDLNQIRIAGTHLASMMEPALLHSLHRYYENRSNQGVLRRLQTPSGVILIGGTGPNIYNLDESFDVIAVVDFGGDDIYEEGSVTESRRVIAILDLNGNDVYRGKQPAIQGGSILGASLLFDQSGNDKYESDDIAQGSSLSGIGILVDAAGNDTYFGDRRVQGQSVDGFGILVDRSGNDHYRAALFAQGLGGPLGAGLLVDGAGEDRYFAGGKYPDPYDDSPGFASWSQGVGAGARDVANGGLGVLLDGSGNDIYEADYFSHGGGYWFGAGFVRDFNGDDQRLGAVRSNFDGTPRTEKLYLRWGTGFGSHYGAGFVFDDHGNDSYQGDWAAIAYAWDVGIGVLFEGEGNDRYQSRGSGVVEARTGGLALLYDVRGTDRYIGNGLGNADKQKRLLSFALLLDRGGQDYFNQAVKNHSRAERGWKGGLFIDR
jgi:hypothetical protein